MTVPRKEIRHFDTGHYETAEPSHHLRWAKTGELQQGWIIIRFDSLDQKIGARIEWRSIPEEQ